MPSGDDGHSAADRIRLVAVVGPTAVGKSALAVRLALRFRGEIICADSRQIYRAMDIGTAKPPAPDRAAVPHHLFDVVAPDEVLTLAQYQQLAGAAIVDIAARGGLPMLVGGTGLYLRAVLEGWTIPAAAPDRALRDRLASEAAALGRACLHERLRLVDPVAAGRIDPRNTRRVIRALEVYHTTGQPISSRQHKRPPAYQTLIVGLTLPRDELYRRIDRRVDDMMARGLVEEVRQLLASGYDESLPAMSGLGYKQIVSYLRGRGTLAQAVQAVKMATRRYVRRQYAWFRLDDPAVRWFESGESPLERAAAAVEQFLAPAGAG